jgi:hypothetical protein
MEGGPEEGINWAGLIYQHLHIITKGSNFLQGLLVAEDLPAGLIYQRYQRHTLSNLVLTPTRGVAS